MKQDLFFVSIILDSIGLKEKCYCWNWKFK